MLKNLPSVRIFGQHAGIGNQLQFIPCLKQLLEGGFTLSTDCEILKDFFPEYFSELSYSDIGILIYNLGYYYAKKYKNECDKLIGFQYSVRGKILPILSKLHIDCSPLFNVNKSEILNNFQLLDCFWNEYDFNKIDYSIPISTHKKKCVGIAATSGNNPEKRWQGWPELILKIIDDGFDINLFGLDISENQRIKDIAQNHQNIHIINTPTLLDAAHEISSCAYFVANDTGLMHLADALHIPVIALFGMTNVLKNHPWNESNRVVCLNLACAPCYTHGKVKCSNKEKYKCMKIPFQDVYNAFSELRSINEQ
jgi:hypothetical protein